MEQLTIERKIGHRYQKGHAPLPGAGRPKGSGDVRMILLRALAKVEKEKGITFAEHFCKEAFKSDARSPQLMVAMAKKLWPDLTNETGDRGPSRIEIHYTFNAPVPVVPATNRISGLLPSENMAQDAPGSTITV